jgi:hypothetical protein
VGVIVRNDESKTQDCGVKAHYCLKYNNVKTLLCKGGRKVLGTEKNPEDNLNIVFVEEVLRLADNSTFPPINHTDDSCLRWGRL